MDETLEIILRARDEMSAQLRGVQGELGRLNDRANLAGRGIGFLKSALMGVATGIGIAAWFQLEEVFSRLASAIPDLIGKGMVFGEKVNELQETTGGTAEATSRLLGVLTILGVNTDQLGLRMGRLSKAIMENEADLNRWGIVTRDAAGKPLDLITQIEAVRQGLDHLGPGSQRTAEALALFSRTGTQMNEFLSLSDAQMKLLNDEMDRLGVTLDENGVMKAERASREFNLFGLSIQGVANKLFSDVAPALISAVDAIASWVRDNSAAIAGFAANAANFVLGVITALTGATFKTITFTDALGKLAGAAGETSDGLYAAADAGKANTASFDAQTKAIDREITALQNLDAAAQRRYESAMRQLGAELQAELDLLTTEERRRANAAEDARAKRDLADATRALGDAQRALAEVDQTKDPAAYAAAQDAVLAASRRVGDIRQAMAETATARAEQERQDEIRKTQDYIAAIEDAEKSSRNRRALLTQLHKNEKILAADLARDRAIGDENAVKDDLAKIEAVKTSIKRVAEQVRAGDRTTDLQDAKKKIADEKQAFLDAFGKGGAVPTGVTAGFGAISAAVLGDSRHGGAEGGGGGLVGAFKGAREAGLAFGAEIKRILDEITKALPAVVTGIGGIATVIGQLTSLVATAGVPIGLSIAALGASTGNIGLVLAGLGIAGIGVAGLTSSSAQDQEKARQGAGLRGLQPGAVHGSGQLYGNTPVIANGFNIGSAQWGSGGGSVGAVPFILQPQTTVHTILKLDGKTIADVVDRYLAAKYRLGR